MKLFTNENFINALTPHQKTYIKENSKDNEFIYFNIIVDAGNISITLLPIDADVIRVPYCKGLGGDSWSGTNLSLCTFEILKLLNQNWINNFTKNSIKEFESMLERVKVTESKEAYEAVLKAYTPAIESLEAQLPKE